MRILIWAATAGLGFLGGWLFVPTDDAPPVNSLPPAIEKVEDSPPDTPPPEPAQEVARDDRSSEPGPADESAAVGLSNAEIPSGESLAAILERFPVREYEMGDGVITGIALDANGNPAEGVQVSLVVHGTTPGVEQRGLESPNVLDYALEEIDQYHFDRALIRHATSGVDGAFRFEQLSPDFEYHAHPGLENDQYVYLEGETQQLSPGAELTARALPGAWLDGDIVDRDGAPVRPAWLQFQVEIEGERVRLSVPYGHTSPERLVPTVMLEAQALSQARERSEARDLQLAPGEHAHALFVVKGRPSLTVVPGGSTDPVDFMNLECSVIAEVELAALSELSDADYRRNLRYSGQRLSLQPGRPSTRGFEPGDYRMFLLRDGNVLHEEGVRIADGPVEVSIAVPPIDRAGIFIVTVTTSEGARVEEANFQVEYTYSGAGGEGSGSSSISSVRLGSGRFAARWQPDPDEFGPGIQVDAKLACESSEFGRASMAIGASSGGEVSITFETPGFLTVDLADYVGNDLQGRVGLTLASTAGRNGNSANPDPLGRARFGPLTPGSYDVTLYLTKQRRYSNTMENVATVEVFSGENQLLLPLPVFHSVTIRFPDTEPGMNVWMQKEEGSMSASAVIDRDGVAVLEDLTAGNYKVYLHQGQGSSMSVTVPTAGELVYAPVRMDVLAVAIHDEQGWLAQAGFRTGDKIVSLDGETFENVRGLQFALLRAFSADGGLVEVQRGGALISIPITAGEVTDYNALGGLLEPAARGGSQ